MSSDANDARISAFSRVSSISSSSFTQAGLALTKSSCSISLPVSMSFSVIGRRHCSGMLNLTDSVRQLDAAGERSSSHLLRSDGRTPSHFMSGVVRLELS